MSFRRRNIGIPASTNARVVSSTTTPENNASVTSRAQSETPSGDQPTETASPLGIPGTRPSPIDGRLTTSTGVSALDKLLAGHAGLALGTSVLIEESGTTDYGGALLRYFAAEGLIQGHQLHVVGTDEKWGRELPGLVGAAEKGHQTDQGDGSAAGRLTKNIEKEKMKIAWRYERLSRGEPRSEFSSRDSSTSQRQIADDDLPRSTDDRPFCHVFDLRKKLEHPPNASISYLKISHHPGASSPFTPVLEQLQKALASSSPDLVHRLIIPALLAPHSYPPHASQPYHVIQFLKGVRALLSLYPCHLVAMVSLPLSLFPRISGLVRWMELLSDGVIELAPFPHSYGHDPPLNNPSSTEAEAEEQPPQGLLKFHRLPVFHATGVGTNAETEDWAFSLSRRKLVIKPYSLPPIDGDTQAQQGTGAESSQPKAEELEF